MLKMSLYNNLIQGIVYLLTKDYNLGRYVQVSMNCLKQYLKNAI